MGPWRAPARRFVRPRRRAGALVPVLTTTLAVVVLALGGSPAAAAAPSPAVDALPGVEAWLDSELQVPPDVPAGGHVEIGVTFWSPRTNALAPVSGLTVKLFPRKGHAAPSVVKGTSDFPGHLVAVLKIPEGGAGRLELDSQAQQCDAGGSCKDIELPVPFEGTGPPPDAPPASLYVASLVPIVGDVVANRPFPIAILLQPRGLWSFADLTPPAELTASATNQVDRSTTNATLASPRGDGTPYQGHLTILEPGQATLGITIPGSNGAADQPVAFADDHQPVLTVIEAGRRPDATPAAVASPAAGRSQPPQSPADDASGDSGIPLVVWLGLGAVLVLAAALFLSPYLRRGRDRDGP